MWSKFTEYAEGIVEIVAQADATASAAVAASAASGGADAPHAASDSASHGAVQSPPRSVKGTLSGEEIWSRFASVVAPPADAPLSQTSASNADAPRSAPPSLDELRTATTAAANGSARAAPPDSPTQQRVAQLSHADEDEQEQYICELERALLQRKKQNEALEKKMYELEYQHEQALARERSRMAQDKLDSDTRIAALAREIEALRAQQTAAAAVGATEEDGASDRSTDAASDAALEATVTRLEQQLRNLNARCSALQTTFDHVRRTGADTGSPAPVGAAGSPPVAASASRVPHLVQVAQSLSATLRSTARSSSSSSDSDASTTDTSSWDVAAYASEDALVAQVLELSTQVRDSVERQTAHSSALAQMLGAFLARHCDGSPDAPLATVQQQLESVSARLVQSAVDATEAARVLAKLRALEESEETQLKQTLHLQAQVRSMQASRDRTDQSLQQTVSREAELIDELDARDETIRQLEASVKQVRASMEHLAHELKDAQSYTDELEGFCRRQKSELDAQRRRVSELEATETQLRALQEQEQETRARASEFEQGYVRLLAEIETLRAESEAESQRLVATSEAHAASTENQTIFALEAQLSAADADKQVALQDAARLQASVDALEGVLHQFQCDQKHLRERLLELEDALSHANAQLATQQQQQSRASRSGQETDDSRSSDLQRVMDVLAKKTLECEQLREALETTAAQYSAANDVLDKRLAAQLVVAYCETEKKGEVLQLIARMMGFSEDQKRRVGLGFPVDGNGGGGLFSSILGFVAPPPSSGGDGSSAAPAVSIDGKSFADIWTEFLLNEAKK